MSILVLAAEDPGAARLIAGGREYRAAIGRGGAVAHKREGDGGTPIGRWPLRRLFWRPDRLPCPASPLPTVALTPDMGWGDDPGDKDSYNRLITLPAAHSHERLWRDDALYDLVVEVGYNDAPPEPGKGSAIFIHIARPNYAATEGCVALQLEDLQAVLAGVGPQDMLEITRIWP